MKMGFSRYRIFRLFQIPRMYTYFVVDKETCFLVGARSWTKDHAQGFNYLSPPPPSTHSEPSSCIAGIQPFTYYLTYAFLSTDMHGLKYFKFSIAFLSLLYLYDLITNCPYEFASEFCFIMFVSFLKLTHLKLRVHVLFFYIACDYYIHGLQVIVFTPTFAVGD